MDCYGGQQSDDKQWGKHARTTDYEQITFPISFTNVNYTCISTSYDLNSNADVTSAYSGTYNSGKYPEEQERTVSRFYVKTGSNAGGRDWIAIGQQQWGIKAASTYTWTYPLPLAVVYYADMMGYRKGSAGSEYGWIRSISPIAFETYIIDESAICFCVGIAQQWGVVTDDRSTLTFLLPFSNSDYFYAAFPTNKVNIGGINLHGVRNPTYLELYSSISNDSNTANNWQFGVRTINPCWLAVGIQQWGYTTSYNKVTVNFPVAYSTQIFCLTAFHSAPGVSTLDIYASHVTLNGFAFSVAAPDSAFTSFERAYWLSIGVQQWGSNNPSPITYPISFTKTVFTVLPILQTADGGNMSKNRLYVTSLTVNGFTIYNPQNSYNWLAVGR